MIHLLLGSAFLSALVDWVSVWKKNKQIEKIFKPLTIGLLMSWVIGFSWQEGLLKSNLIYFFVGLGFCLVGDVFLFLPPEKYFVPGLAAFLLGHISYIAGLGGLASNSNLMIPFVIFLLVILVVSSKIVGRLVAGLKELKKERLRVPVIFYAGVISVMLASAGSRFFDPHWTTAGAYLVAGGAILFYISDVLNAWERFVNKFNHDRLIIMVTYHLGQFGLVTGAALHFAGKFPS